MSVRLVPWVWWPHAGRELLRNTKESGEAAALNLHIFAKQELLWIVSSGEEVTGARGWDRNLLSPISALVLNPSLSLHEIP